MESMMAYPQSFSCFSCSGPCLVEKASTGVVLADSVGGHGTSFMTLVAGLHHPSSIIPIVPFLSEKRVFRVWTRDPFSVRRVGCGFRSCHTYYSEKPLQVIIPVV